MNKYQEAFISIQDNKYMYGTDEQWDLLKELVEKATPKKPEYKEKIRKDNYRDGTNIGRFDWWCPNCHLEHISGNDINYCPTCGQALDWSDE